MIQVAQKDITKMNYIDAIVVAANKKSCRQEQVYIKIFTVVLVKGY